MVFQDYRQLLTAQLAETYLQGDIGETNTKAD